MFLIRYLYDHLGQICTSLSQRVGYWFTPIIQGHKFAIHDQGKDCDSVNSL